MKKFFSLILIIIFFSLIIFSFFGSWYSVHQKTKQVTLNIDFGLDNIRVRLDTPTKTSEIFYEYDVIIDQGETFRYENVSQKHPFEILKILIILTIIFAVICLIVNVGNIFNFGNKIINMGSLAILLNLIVMLFCFIIPVYFSKVYQDAMEPFTTNANPSSINFWHSFNFLGYEYSHGPGLSWYAILIAGFIILLTIIILKKYPFVTSGFESSQEIQNTINKKIDANYHPCPKCNTNIPLDSRECPFCGTKFY